ncbi:unnamed protein product [Linum tenue]|uniref:Uncharacterized protein n=1 Tax=Linum tenue TaxID=586396 RepID=A0AAV0KM19_9ROSI|nr:unnamed protein product [Linum tenue]
MIQVVPLLAV